MSILFVKACLEWKVKKKKQTRNNNNNNRKNYLQNTGKDLLHLMLYDRDNLLPLIDSQVCNLFF